MAENESVSLYLDTELIAVLRARAKAAGMSFSSFVGEQLQSSLEDAPKRIEAKPTAAAVSKEQIVKAMRDALKSIKKVSPIKTELVELLTSFLKDAPKSLPTLADTLSDLNIADDDPELDDWIQKRSQRNKPPESQSMQAVGSVFLPGGALERAASRGAITPDEVRQQLDSMKAKDVAPRNEPSEPTVDEDEDWYPDE